MKLLRGTLRMSVETTAALVGGVAGAVAGSLVSLAFATATGERQERGRRRIEARNSVSSATQEFLYAVGEARLKLYELRKLDEDYTAKATTFAGIVSKASLSLPPLERWRLQRKLRKIVGSDIYQLAELRPSSTYAVEADAAALMAISEARPTAEQPLFDAYLLHSKPTDRRWDDLLDAMRRLQKRYP
jgi:gas vesicle protein